MATLPSLEFIDPKTVFYHRMELPGADAFSLAQGTEITANCIYGGKPCLTIQIAGDTLTKVEVSLNYGIQVPEALGYLGNPDYVGYRNLGAEELWCEVDLLWIDRQLVLASPVFKGAAEVDAHCGPVHDTGKIPPSMPISEVRYWSLPAIERLRGSAAGKFFKYSGMLPSK